MNKRARRNELVQPLTPGPRVPLQPALRSVNGAGTGLAEEGAWVGFEHMDESMARPLVSVVIPCLDEAETIERCVYAAQRALDQAGLDGEVIVADNGSSDGSADLASKAGALVVHEPRRGYGSAYLAGFGAARGRYVVMADADLTYDFGDIPRFVDRLVAGADLVMGDRSDGIEPGAMPWHH